MGSKMTQANLTAILACNVSFPHVRAEPSYDFGRLQLCERLRVLAGRRSRKGEEKMTKTYR
jgi:hypothetical protein